MATWRLLSLNSPINLLCTRKLATAKTALKIKRDIEKSILPTKPKKPLNPYLLYFYSVKSKWQQEYPDIKYAELVKKISQEWTKVDSTIKEQFQKQHDEQQVIYKQKINEYNNSITKEQRVLLIKNLTEKKGAVSKGQVKQKLLELGKPKKPLTPYFIFMTSKRYNKDPKIPQKEWLKNISDEWNNMTTKDKEKYYIEAKQLQEKYQIEFKKWEEDMIQAGHSDLLTLDSECPNQTNLKTAESITMDFLSIETQNKDHKTGWGTDITSSTGGNVPHADNVSDQQHECTRNFTPYNARNDLQALTKYSRNETKDMLINDSKSVQPHIYVGIYKYFFSVWKRFLLVLKKISNKNWRTKNTNTNGPL